MYFMIHELLGFLEIRYKVLSRVCILPKTAHHTQKYLFDCFIVFYRIILWKFFQLSFQVALHFHSRKYESRQLFNRWDMHFLWAWQANFGVFSCETKLNMARKTWFKVCGESLCTVSTQKETHLWTKVYLCISKIQALIGLFFLIYGLLLQVNGSLTWSQKDQQTSIHTYIHTHTLFSMFSV